MVYNNKVLQVFYLGDTFVTSAIKKYSRLAHLSLCIFLTWMSPEIQFAYFHLRHLPGA